MYQIITKRQQIIKYWNLNNYDKLCKQKYLTIWNDDEKISKFGQWKLFWVEIMCSLQSLTVILISVNVEKTNFVFHTQ